MSLEEAVTDMNQLNKSNGARNVLDLLIKINHNIREAWAGEKYHRSSIKRRKSP